MTNFEKIKSMGVEELAKVLYGPITTCGYCPAREVCKRNISNCKDSFIKWLKSEEKK